MGDTEELLALFRDGGSLDEQLIWLLATSHYVRCTKAAAVFIKSSGMFALVIHHRRYEITHMHSGALENLH